MTGEITSYSCKITDSAVLGAAPDDVGAKSHHVKGGRGFTNPWASWTELSIRQIAWMMIGYEIYSC
jgi:N-acyl-phosphatidylethanolamine-hydrolysing phospholipase D